MYKIINLYANIQNLLKKCSMAILEIRTGEIVLCANIERVLKDFDLIYVVNVCLSHFSHLTFLSTSN